MGPRSLPVLCCARLLSLWQEFSKRDAVLSFLWSRLRTSGDNNPARYVQATHATYEDFLEAICRVADMKVLPDFDVDVVEWDRKTPSYEIRECWLCVSAAWNALLFVETRQRRSYRQRQGQGQRQ